MTLTIQGILTSLQSGSITIGPFTIPTNAGGNTATTSLQLASGANTISVPSWSVGCVIVPNSSNAVGITLKGVSGDTGVPLSLTTPNLVTFPASPPASFVLTSASTGATQLEVLFF